MGSCCDKVPSDPQSEIEIPSSKATTVPLSQHKYYDDLKHNHQRLLEARRNTIQEKEAEVATLQQKAAALPNGSFERQRIERQIAAHLKIVEQKQQ